MAGCTTDWSLERKPGGAWLYDEAAMEYNDVLFDGYAVSYEAVGLTTVWTFEDPIDGCNFVITYLDFQDGVAATFQNGTVIQFNG